MKATKPTDTTVTALITDLTKLITEGKTGCFVAAEVQPIVDRLVKLAAQQLEEPAYNAKARLYVWGLMCLGLDTRDGPTMFNCPVMWRCQEAHEDLMDRRDALR